MDSTQIIVAVVIVGLVAVAVLLRRKSNQASEPNLPAVSEDVNLPVVSQPTSQPKDELDNNGPQQ